MDSSNVCEECGKSFKDPARLFTHQKKSCWPGKRSLCELLSDARQLWRAKQSRPRKCAKLTEGASRPRPRSGSAEFVDHSLVPSAPQPPDGEQAVASACMSHGHHYSSPMSVGDEQTPIALSNETPVPPTFPQSLSSPFLGPSSTEADVVMMDPPSAESSLNQLVPSQEHFQPEPEHPLQSNREWCTERDVFGLFKHFDSCPSLHSLGGVTNTQYTPKDARIPPSPGIGDEATHQNVSPLPVTHSLSTLQYHPYPNWSSFELGDLLWSRGPINSLDRFNELIQLFRNPAFRLEDVRHAEWDRIHKQLACGTQPGLDTSVEWVDDIGPGWMTSMITLTIPFPTRGTGPDTETYNAGVLHHRKIVSVIKEKLTNPQEHANRHFQAHGVFWQPDLSREPVRVYGEVYTSDEFRKLEEEVRGLPLNNEEDRGLERVVLALMFWTDATLLAKFGAAELWPCYLFFGNDSKYLRASPTSNLCNHIAYFDSLPDDFKDWYRSQNKGRNPSKELITHCNREIFQRQWDILLDDELVEAMSAGIRITCPDNVTRLFFPRVFTYSADYPEKVLVATIRSMGTAPCPRCFVKKCEIHEMGSESDMLARSSTRRVDDHSRQEQVRLTRDVILKEGYAVNSDEVKKILPRSGSMVPVENAFSKLSPLGFNVYSCLAVDLMHEFELGVWKAIFIHLVRILEAEDRAGKGSVSELDKRYRSIPAFGTDTIRKFFSNASEQKRMAARDYANLLQCALPVFDHLLPEPHNTIVHDLLFVLAEWHALAKLRLHTELTVNLLEVKTVELAKNVHTFMEVTCQAFQTVETAKEYATRLKRSAKKAEKVNPTPAALDETIRHPDTADLRRPAELTVPSVVLVENEQENQPTIPSSTSERTSKGRLPKTFNIQTYKYHALADYAYHIRRFGTTDSYSTERGELEHKLPKSWFLRTNKRAYRRQLARIERRRANLRKIRQKATGKCGTDPKSTTSRTKRVPVPGRMCSYVIAKSQSSHLPLSHFYPQEVNKNDPALKDFLPGLQEHVRIRMETTLQKQYPERFVNGFEPFDIDYLSVVDRRIYTHKTARLLYSSYDGRTGDDIIWPSCAKANIMLINPDHSSNGEHPFIYGKVLGIYHMNVVYVKGFQDLPPTRLDFLWVRWYRWEGKSNGDHSLDIVSFPPVTQPGSFGFVDPGDVLRACHIVPRFLGRPPVPEESISVKAQDAGDYPAYFINRFADRDMFMRYQWGYAVGHCYTHDSVAAPYVDGAPSTSTPPQPGASAIQHLEQREDVQQAGDDDDGDGLLDDDRIDLGEDEMVYQRSDIECSDEDDEDGGDSQSESDEQ